jgi:hypothetical protein
VKPWLYPRPTGVVKGPTLGVSPFTETVVDVSDESEFETDTCTGVPGVHRTT